MRIRREGQRLLVGPPGVDVEVTAEDVRSAAAHVVRASLGVFPASDVPAGPLPLAVREEGLAVRVPDGRLVPLDVAAVAEWLRAAGNLPLSWDLTGSLVSLRVCGVTVWTAGPQTAATFGMALSLPLEHGGVFFGGGAPFEGAAPTALVPEGHPTRPSVRLLAYTQRKYGLQLREVGRVTVRDAEFPVLHRQLLGLLRALALEQPQTVGALRTLEALGR